MAAIVNVQFSSAVNAPIAVSAGKSPVTSRASGVFLRFLKPTFVVSTPLFDPLTVAPWGAATSSDRSLLLAGVFALLALAGFGLMKFLKRK